MNNIHKSNALASCFDNDSVDKLLDELGMARREERVEYLYDFMGVTHFFSCADGNYSIDDLYEHARTQLIFFNRERRASERAFNLASKLASA